MRVAVLTLHSSCFSNATLKNEASFWNKKSDTPIDMISFPFKIHHYLQPSQNTGSPHLWGAHFLGQTGTFGGSVFNGQRLEGGKDTTYSNGRLDAHCYKKVTRLLKVLLQSDTWIIHARNILEVLFNRILSHGHTILLPFTRPNHLNHPTVDLQLWWFAGRTFLNCPGWNSEVCNLSQVKLPHQILLFVLVDVTFHCSSQQHKAIQGCVLQSTLWQKDNAWS